MRVAGGSKLRVRVGLALLLLLTIPGRSSAQGFSDLFTLEFLFQVDLDAYADPAFRWTTNGAAQAAMNDALTELKEGSADRSVVMFEEAIPLDTNFWPMRYYYAVSLRQTAQYDKARRQLEWLLREKREIPEVHLEFGRLLQQERQPEKAKDQFQLAIRKNPKFAKAYYSLGMVFALNGDLGRARKNFDRCVDIDGASAEAYFGLAMLKVLTTRNLFKLDLSLFDQSLRADSSYRPALFWRGMLEADRGHFDACLRDWGRLIRMAPGNPFLLNMRGYIYIEMERYEDAYADFRKAILQHSASEARYSTGRTPLDKWVDLKNALNYISRKGYGLQDLTFLNIRKGLCLMVVDRHKDALVSLDESILMEPSAPAYLLKAILFEKMYREDSAQYCYVKALQYDNDMFDAHKKRALYFVQQNDWKSTYKEFNEMKRINPDALITYRISGLLKSRFKDYYGCIIDLTRVLKEDTTDAEAWQGRALCRLQVNDHKGAIADIDRAVVLDADNKTYCWSQVHIQLTAGDSLAAVATLKRGWDKNPTDCEMLLAYSDLLLSTGSYEQAQFNTNLLLKNLEERKCAEQWALGNRLRASALFISALVSKHHQKPDQALSRMNESLALFMDYDRLFERFLLLLGMNRTDEALRDLKTLKSANYERAGSYYSEYLK